MSKILFVLRYGLGNCVQSIPAYLSLCEKHDVTAVYEKIYPTDSVLRAGFFPVAVKEVDVVTCSEMSRGYDYTVNIPFGLVADKNHNFVRDVLDNISELDSEVERSMKYCEHFDCTKDIIRGKVASKPSKDFDDRKYVILHNGSLDNDSWRMKKYRMFERLALLIKRELGLEVASIGSEDEYIKGTINLTGKELLESSAYIENCKYYIGTDSGMYHIAGYLEVPGTVLFTATSVSKNWDKNFHHTIEPIKQDTCKYGQWGYHWHPACGECRQTTLYHPCQTIDPWKILKKVAGALSAK